MRINPTILEILLLLIISCSIFIWAKYGKKITRWWKDLDRKRRAAGQLNHGHPKPVQRVSVAIIVCHIDLSET